MSLTVKQIEKKMDSFKERLRQLAADEQDVKRRRERLLADFAKLQEEMEAQ